MHNTIHIHNINYNKERSIPVNILQEMRHFNQKLDNYVLISLIYLKKITDSKKSSLIDHMYVQDPRDGFGDYHSSSPERSQQRSQQP